VRPAKGVARSLGFAYHGLMARLKVLGLDSPWPELAINRIRFHDATLRIRATAGGVAEIQTQGGGDETVALRLPEADCKVTLARADGSRAETLSRARANGQSVARLRWPEGGLIRVERIGVR
jgi:hypothetical protein